MGQVLYRKYRSKTLDEIVGQEHITSTLSNALKSGEISHAYLFTGPRGVGKTSIARILAHELNQLAYTGEEAHLDIIEIDAASNRGIDEIRDLREKVSMAPVNGKYKVYIIDEVHMLTTPAFNALLKTLEEPPAHVVFILATTESHKLPATIISRTQRYNFRPVEKAKVVAHLAHIAKQEKLKIEPEALDIIADHGEGSFRDSISLLNQAAAHTGTITAETVQEILGLPPETMMLQLFEAVGQSKLTVVTVLHQLYEQGYQASTVAKLLGNIGREAVIGQRSSSLDETALLQLLAGLLEVPSSSAPERLLEIVLMQASPTSPAVAPKVSAAEVTTKPASKAKPANPKKLAQTKAETTEKPSKAPVAEAALATEPVAFELDVIWPELLKAIKTKHNTIYGILRMATPQLSGDELQLTFAYAFHQKRMAESKHRKIISDYVAQLTGRNVTINCVYDKNADAAPALPPANEVVTPLTVDTNDTKSPISTISNIFGGAELLES